MGGAVTEYETASLIAQYVGVAIGLAQCVLIWAGIRLMRRAAESRDRGIDAQRRADDQRHAEAVQNHAEAMRALEALIERTAPKTGAP